MFGSSPIELLAADAMLRGAIFCQSFTYSAQWLTGTTTALGATATVPVITQITSDSDFVVQEIQFNSWSAAGTIIVDPDYTLMLTIASGRPWFDQVQPIRNLVGSYASTQQPNSLPFPRLIPAQSTLTSTLANRTGTASNQAVLSFMGFCVYYQSNQDGSPATRQQIFHAL